MPAQPGAELSRCLQEPAAPAYAANPLEDDGGASAVASGSNRHLDDKKTLGHKLKDAWTGKTREQRQAELAARDRQVSTPPPPPSVTPRLPR